MQPLHEELASIADKLWYIHGNQVTDSKQDWNDLWGSRLAARNINGKVVTLPNGIRISAGWGAYAEKASGIPVCK